MPTGQALELLSQWRAWRSYALRLEAVGEWAPVGVEAPVVTAGEQAE